MMSERESHGTNCAHRSDSDEPCTCSVVLRIALQTEQTMHAAWRKRAEEAEADNTELEQACEVFAHCVAVETRNGIDPKDPNYDATKQAHESVIANPLANCMVVKARDKVDAARARGATQ